MLDAVPMEYTNSAVSISEIEEVVHRLSCNKAIGADMIPAEVLKYSGRRLTVLLSLLVSGCFKHNYLPDMIMRVTLVPLLKGNLKDRTQSDNYRPIAIATSI